MRPQTSINHHDCNKYTENSNDKDKLFGLSYCVKYVITSNILSRYSSLPFIWRDVIYFCIIYFFISKEWYRRWLLWKYTFKSKWSNDSNCEKLVTMHLIYFLFILVIHGLSKRYLYDEQRVFLNWEIVRKIRNVIFVLWEQVNVKGEWLEILMDEN